MKPEELENLAMNLYSKLYAKYDGITQEQARQDYEANLANKRKDCLNIFSCENNPFKRTFFSTSA